MFDEGHVSPGQQGSPSPPHDSQNPFAPLHTSVVPPTDVQTLPAAMQMLEAAVLSQHPPVH